MSPTQPLLFTRRHGITETEWRALIARARTGSLVGGARELGVTLQTFKNHIQTARIRLGTANIWETYRKLGWLVLPADDGTDAVGTPHPDEAHEFQMRFFKCGEQGYVHVVLITDTERVRVVQT